MDKKVKHSKKGESNNISFDKNKLFKETPENDLDVVVKCKETSKGLKVIIKKVGTKKVNKSFIIPNEISNDCVLTR